MHAADHFVSLNGLRIHYREWGEGRSSAPAVVLLHGGTAHAHWWDFFAASIATHHHVCAPDLRGHGDSERPHPPAYRIDDYADDLAAFIAARRLGRIHLVGHSLGALISTAYADRAPHSLQSLVIVDSQVRISAADARYMTRLRHFPHPIYADRELAIRRFRLLPTATDADPKILAHVAAHGVRQLADGRWTPKFDRNTLAHSKPRDLSGILPQLHCPILFVRGAHSTVLSHAGLATLLKSVPHAEAAEIPNAHHHVMLDNPAAFAAAVGGFLDRYAANGAAAHTRHSGRW